jgi:hypothetical protein
MMKKMPLGFDPRTRLKRNEVNLISSQHTTRLYIFVTLLYFESSTFTAPV